MALVDVVAGHADACASFVDFLSAVVPRGDASAAMPTLISVPGGLNNNAVRLGNLLIKIYGQAISQLTDRARERALMAHVCAMSPPGTCKTLVATFDGGHVEEWVEGSTLPFAEMKVPRNWNDIARLLARLHACPLPSDAPGCTGGRTDALATAVFFEDMMAWADGLPPTLPTRGRPPSAAPCPMTRARLIEEVAWLQEIPASSAACIAHRDVHGANLVSTPEGTLRLIDFEFLQVNPISCPRDRTATAVRSPLPCSLLAGLPLSCRWGRGVLTSPTSSSSAASSRRARPGIGASSPARPRSWLSLQHTLMSCASSRAAPSRMLPILPPVPSPRLPI